MLKCLNSFSLTVAKKWTPKLSTQVASLQYTQYCCRCLELSKLIILSEILSSRLYILIRKTSLPFPLNAAVCVTVLIGLSRPRTTCEDKSIHCELFAAQHFWHVMLHFRRTCHFWKRRDKNYLFEDTAGISNNNRQFKKHFLHVCLQIWYDGGLCAKYWLNF